MPSRPLLVPRVTRTSSSLRIGMARTFEGNRGLDITSGTGKNLWEKIRGHTLCFSRRSLLRGALIITRRTLDGALKCAFRDFLREEWRARSVGFV